MRERWILKGNYWRIPIWVTHTGGHLVEVKAGGGIYLLDNQRKAAETLLGHLGERVGSKFFIPLERLKLNAEITERGAEAVLQWFPFNETSEPHGTLRSPSPDVNEFCESFFAMHANTRFRSVSEVVYIFNALCRHMFDRLLNRFQPVDLGFCVLHPTPYRPNWKNVVYSLEQSKAPSEKKEMLFVHHHLFDYEPTSRTLRWAVDVMMAKPWWDQVKELEVKRRSMVPHYWEWWVDFTFSKCESFRELYDDWKKHLYNPHPILSSGDGGERMAIDAGRSGKWGVAAPSVAPHTLNAKQDTTSSRRRVLAKDGSVQSVRDIRSLETAMRRWKGLLAQCRKESKRKKGLPLRDGSCSVEPPEKLLAL